MNWRSKKTIAVGAAVVAAVGGGVGGAVAASGSDSPAAGKQAFLNDAAGRLGVQPAALESALEGAATDRVDAAVAAGRLTQVQGDRVKQRIRSGQLGLPGHRRPFVRGLFAAAASYLGLTPAQLLGQLRAGSSLADVATAKSKTVDGLESAILADAKSRLDAAVQASRLTSDQEQKLLAGLESRLADLVNRKGLPLRGSPQSTPNP